MSVWSTLPPLVHTRTAVLVECSRLAQGTVRFHTKRSHASSPIVGDEQHGVSLTNNEVTCDRSTRGDLIEKLEHPALFVERETTDEAVRLAADFADGVQVILGGVERQKRRALYFPDKPDLLQFAGSGIEAQ